MQQVSSVGSSRENCGVQLIGLIEAVLYILPRRLYVVRTRTMSNFEAKRSALTMTCASFEPLRRSRESCNLVPTTNEDKRGSEKIQKQAHFYRVQTRDLLSQLSIIVLFYTIVTGGSDRINWDVLYHYAGLHLGNFFNSIHTSARIF